MMAGMDGHSVLVQLREYENEKGWKPHSAAKLVAADSRVKIGRRKSDAVGTVAVHEFFHLIRSAVGIRIAKGKTMLFFSWA